MAFYLLFTFNLALVIFRTLKTPKALEKIPFVALSLFLLLTLAMHFWIAHFSTWLAFLEKATLVVSLLWLASDPILRWSEKRRVKKRSLEQLRKGTGPFAEILEAARMLAEAKQGALIAIERKDSLEKWTRSGVLVEARIRKETIYSIFTPPGALHDGGVIIRNERIAAAGVLFPLSKRLDLPTELGTRHRAGLGLSETADALVIIVSEETGKISLADKGVLLYDIKSDRLQEFLENALKNRSPKRHKNPVPVLGESVPNLLTRF